MIVAITVLGTIASVIGAWWGYVSRKNRVTEREEQAAHFKLEKLDLPPMMFALITVHELLDLEMQRDALVWHPSEIRL